MAQMRRMGSRGWEGAGGSSRAQGPASPKATMRVDVFGNKHLRLARHSPAAGSPADSAKGGKRAPESETDTDSEGTGSVSFSTFSDPDDVYGDQKDKEDRVLTAAEATTKLARRQVVDTSPLLRT